MITKYNTKTKDIELEKNHRVKRAAFLLICEIDKKKLTLEIAQFFFLFTDSPKGSNAFLTTASRT